MAMPIPVGANSAAVSRTSAFQVVTQSDPLAAAPATVHTNPQYAAIRTCTISTIVHTDTPGNMTKYATANGFGMLQIAVWSSSRGVARMTSKRTNSSFILANIVPAEPRPSRCNYAS